MTTPSDRRKVIFGPGRVRVSGARLRGIVATPPPDRTPGGQGHGTPGGGRGQGKGGGKGKGGGNSLSELALALAATSASQGKVVPSPPDVGAVTLICSQVLSVAAASFDTNTILGGNLPASYHHLEIRANLRAADAVTNREAWLRLNNDSAANYTQQLLEGGGASAVAIGTIGTSAISCGFIPGSTAPASGSSPLRVDVFDYTSTTFFKQSLSQCYARKTTLSTGLSVDVTGGSWLNTAAVTRLTLLPSAGNFDVGSSFYLYGIT